MRVRRENVLRDDDQVRRFAGFERPFGLFAPPHSARSAPARKSASATSLAPSYSVLAVSLCLPPRHPAQCSTPPRPHKMPFTYRSHCFGMLACFSADVLEGRLSDPAVTRAAEN